MFQCPLTRHILKYFIPFVTLKIVTDRIIMILSQIVVPIRSLIPEWVTESF